jgi:hypothetical protein
MVDIIIRFSLQPIMTSLFPIAAQSKIVEVVGMACTMSAAWSDIEDIVFIVPIQELESGMVHITGATNLYFARYCYNERDDKLLPYPFSLYFSIQYISPFSFQIFSLLNMLSHNLKKALFHVPESQEPKRVSDASFQLKHFIPCSLKLVNGQLSRHQPKGVSV